MIRYKKYQMTGEKSPLKGLWYARPLIEDTFDTFCNESYSFVFLVFKLKNSISLLQQYEDTT